LHYAPLIAIVITVTMPVALYPLEDIAIYLSRTVPAWNALYEVVEVDLLDLFKLHLD